MKSFGPQQSDYGRVWKFKSSAGLAAVFVEIRCKKEESIMTDIEAGVQLMGRNVFSMHYRGVWTSGPEGATLSEVQEILPEGTAKSSARVEEEAEIIFDVAGLFMTMPRTFLAREVYKTQVMLPNGKIYAVEARPAEGPGRWDVYSGKKTPAEGVSKKGFLLLHPKTNEIEELVIEGTKIGSLHLKRES